MGITMTHNKYPEVRILTRQVLNETFWVNEWFLLVLGLSNLVLYNSAQVGRVFDHRGMGSSGATIRLLSTAKRV